MLEAEGTVVSFAHDLAEVDVTIGGQTRRVLAKRNGKMSMRHIFVNPGDRVRVEISPFDLSRGRIVYRLDRT